MKVVGFVYKIINTENQKVYIGITKCSIKKRWNEHKCCSQNKNNNHFLYRAIRKHGFEKFSIHIIKTCFSDQQLYNSEIYFIRLFNSANRINGYNNSTGGEASNKGMKHSEETKRRISEIQKGNRLPNSGSFSKGHKPIITENSRKMISERMKNRLVSQETKDKISKTLTGRKNGPLSEETKKKISISHKGRKMPDHVKEKLRLLSTGRKAWNKGIPCSEEKKLKISKSKTGIKQTPEVILKRSIAIKESWVKRKQNANG